MKVVLVAYTRVAVGLVPKPPVLRAISQPVEQFLGAHVDHLLSGASGDDAMPPGKFTDAEVQLDFQTLYRGSEDEFLGATLRLAERLIGSMDGRTSEGLLLALRAEDDSGGRYAGILKMQVAENGAVLERLESREVQLSAVTGMLEQPGALQKAALTTNTLPPNEVVCADRLPAGAQYFPKAFAIRLFAKPSAATKAFFEVAQQIAPDLMSGVAMSWPTLEPGFTRDVLDALVERVPGLTPELQERIIDALARSPRSVVRLDTRRRVKQSFKIGGITLSGPVEEMAQLVRVIRQPEHGWRVSVDAADQPSPVYSSTLGR